MTIEVGSRVSLTRKARKKFCDLNQYYNQYGYDTDITYSKIGGIIRRITDSIDGDGKTAYVMWDTAIFERAYCLRDLKEI